MGGWLLPLALGYWASTEQVSLQGESVDKKVGQGTCLPFNFLTFKRQSEQERSKIARSWRTGQTGSLGDQLVGIPRPPPSCRAWSNSSDTRRLAKIQRADFANSAPARGRREGCRGSGVGKKIMHGPWMSWRTSIRADEFRPIFYAPPVRRTIIDEQCSQPSSCLLVAGTVGLGRRKRA